MVNADSSESGSHLKVQLWAEVVFHAILRVLQLVLGLTVIGLYRNGLARRNKPAGYDQSKWV